jgi:hypothetical protein
LRPVYGNPTQGTNNIAQWIPEYGVLDQEGGTHSCGPDKGDGEKKIDVRTVRHEGNNGFVSIGEFTLNPPTHDAEDRSANAPGQEVTAFGQPIPEYLPLHVTASFCSL